MGSLNDKDKAVSDFEIVKLLSQRYGDGFVYFMPEENKDIIKHSRANGFVSDDGYITSYGRQLLAKVSVDSFMPNN